MSRNAEPARVSGRYGAAETSASERSGSSSRTASEGRIEGQSHVRADGGEPNRIEQPAQLRTRTDLQAGEGEKALQQVPQIPPRFLVPRLCRQRPAHAAVDAGAGRERGDLRHLRFHLVGKPLAAARIVESADGPRGAAALHVPQQPHQRVVRVDAAPAERQIDGAPDQRLRSDGDHPGLEERHRHRFVGDRDQPAPPVVGSRTALLERQRFEPIRVEVAREDGDPARVVRPIRHEPADDVLDVPLDVDAGPLLELALSVELGLNLPQTPPQLRIHHLAHVGERENRRFRRDVPQLVGPLLRNERRQAAAHPGDQPSREPDRHHAGAAEQDIPRARRHGHDSVISIPARSAESSAGACAAGVQGRASYCPSTYSRRSTTRIAAASAAAQMTASAARLAHVSSGVCTDVNRAWITLSASSCGMACGARPWR